MRILFIVVFITAISGFGLVEGQTVKYGNNETGDYSSSYKSSNFTYLMWDRNDEGDGNFVDNNRPMFFYWDNDDSKLRYLIDTGNMVNLDASFNSLGIGPSGGYQQYKVLRSGNWMKFDIPYQGVDANLGFLFDVDESAGDARYFFRASGDDLLTMTATSDGQKSELTFGDQDYQNKFYVGPEGKVGVGTASPSDKFTVNGTTKTEEVIVTENVGADFVFEEDYDLPELEEVEAHINKHKHLFEIPSAEEMKENGVKVGDLQMKLLQKIEELTLYTIEQQKKIERSRKTETLLLQKFETQQKLLEKQQHEIEQLKQSINDN